MHIHVLGVGAIGCLIAHHLRRTLPLRYVVTIFHKNEERSEFARANNKIIMETSGVPLTARGFKHEFFPPTSPVPIEERRAMFRQARNRAKFQTLIVCLKTTQTVAAIGSLYSRITPHTTIVLLQNGMGTMEALNATFFKRAQYRPNFVLTTNTHGAWLKGPMHAVHAGVGEIHLGIVPREGGQIDFEKSYPDLNLDDIAPDPGLGVPVDAGEEAADLVRRHASLRATIKHLTSLTALNVHWKPMRDVHTLMRRKLVVNSVINPLTALLDCANGRLFEHAEARSLAMRVCAEAADIFYEQWKHELREAKFHGETLPYTPFPARLQAHELLQECMRVAQKTGDNCSSMLTDVRIGRTTEINSLNGYLVNLGKQYQVRTDANEMLVDLIGLRTSLNHEVPLAAKV
ncbi:ketopantoate reductase PanE/ApbA C terminal-domain-containing protein [Cytidiella melzeri]|nr:ketopantoate reductase PanE/ApbA C terminal-domain-containing protein [Cytidiella melzeri]